MPGAWNNAGHEGEGIATYGLTILCDSAEGLGFFVPAANSSMRIFVNGREIAHQGAPGTTPETTRAAVSRPLAALQGDSCPLRVTVHVANFNHRLGGLTQSPRIGSYERLLLQRERGMAIDEALIGGFLVMALLALLFYFARRADPTPLWLGLFCVCMVLYFVLAKEGVFERLVRPDADWEPYLRLQTVSMYLATPLLALFLRSLYPGAAHRNAVFAVLACSLGAGAAVLVLPARLHSHTLPFMNVVTIGTAVWFVGVLALVSWRLRSFWALALAGMAAFYPVMVLDLLQTNTPLRFALAPFGLFCFVVAPAAVLARRFAHAMNAEELRAKEQANRVDLLGRAAKAGLLDWDAAANRISYSGRFREMLGYPLEADTAKWDFFEFIHPDDREAVRGFITHQLGDVSERDAVRQLKAWEYRLRRIDGTYIWIHAEAIAISGAEGQTLRYVSSFIDITEQRAIQQSLAGERERLALLVHSTKAGFSDWDAVRDVITYSDRFKEMLGHPADADTSKWPNIFSLMHSEDREPMRAQFREMIRRKESSGLQEPGEPMEYRLRRADGSYIWVHAEGIAEVDAAGRTRRFITSFVDITRFREQEQRLRDQVLLTGALIDENPNAMYLKDTQGRYVTVNDAWLRMIGVTREQAVGHTIRELFPDSESERYEAEDRRLIAAGEGSSEVESLRMGPDGKPQWLIVRKAVLRTGDGAVVGLIGTNTDVTGLKRYEAALTTEQRQLDLVVRAARVGIVDWDGRTHQTFYSPRFREIRGYRPDADTSDWPDYFKEMVHPDDRGWVTRRFREYIQGKSPGGPREYYDQDEYRISRADGSHVWIQISGICVRDDTGFATRFIAAITDISERRAQEEALRASVRLREEVERMSRHDLKTPLNSVIAMSRLLRENSKLPAEDAELLDTVERAGYRILNMVNLSLDLFRMEQGTYEFRPQAVDLAEVARKVAADLESQAASKNIDVRVRANNASAASNPVMAQADELLCYSMFANLTKNAIEAAPEGSVVSILLRSEGESVLTEVHNQGAVAEQLRARFFEKYATAGKTAGLGLGTYSAQLMARVQEGELMLRTSESEGTTLIAWLKAAKPGMRPAASGEGVVESAVAQARAQLPPLRVLVVDDDEFNRLVLRRYLPTPPLTLAMAVNGRAALEAAARDWPDVVFLDLEMPVMDGYEAARRLREMERAENRKRCTIVAISSNDGEAIVQRALACGCDHYLVKPAPREVLWKILAGTDAEPDSQLTAQERRAKIPAEESDAVLIDPDLEASLPGFLESRRKLLDEMPEALAAGDRAAFSRLAHKLAGGFALYGFGWAAQRCRVLESDAPAGDAKKLRKGVAAVCAHLEGASIRIKNGVNMGTK